MNPSPTDSQPNQAAINRRRNAIAGIMVEDGWNSDNLCIVLASYFSRHMDRPEGDEDDSETGWSPWAMAKTDAALDRIAEATERIRADVVAENVKLREEVERLRSVMNCQGRRDAISAQMGAPFDEDLHGRMEAGHA